METMVRRYRVGRLLPIGLLSLLAPVHTFAQDTSWIDTFAEGALEAIGAGIPVLVALALAIFIWGGVVMIVSAGDDTSRKEGQTRMLWGLFALFVLVSVWGIVQLIQVFFGVGETTVVPTLPGAEIDS